MATAGWNSSPAVRARLQAALYNARKHRLQRVAAAAEQQPPPDEGDNAQTPEPNQEQ